MKHYLIFAGTYEGRTLIEQLLPHTDLLLTACTATDYGQMLLPKSERLCILSKRLTKEEMSQLMSKHSFDAVLDATHPYAVLVSENIQQAALENALPYYRILRPKNSLCIEDNHLIRVSSMEDAVAVLAKTTGNILCTTGSKELFKLCSLPNFEERVYARILSNPEMTAQSFALGFRGRHLICMQGPFSVEMNNALFHEFDISYLLTKNSGTAGGFPQKIESVRQTGIKAVIIDRPTEETGYSIEELLSKLL